MSDKTVTPRGKRPRVQVSQQDKERAIQRIRNGETKAGISRELGVPESTVRGWVKRADQRLARAAEASMNSVPITKAPPTKNINSTNSAAISMAMSASADSKPAKSTFKGSIVEDAHAHVLGPQFSTFPVLPAALATLQQVSASGQTSILRWLNLFNAGVLNFALIASAASVQSRIRGDSHRSLWELINTFILEYEQFYNSQLMRESGHSTSMHSAGSGGGSAIGANGGISYDEQENYDPYDQHVTADSGPQDITTAWSAALAAVLRSPHLATDASCDTMMEHDANEC